MFVLPSCYNAGDTIPIAFNSNAGSTGASVTISGLAVTDIEIYKDGGTTQRASDNGYTLLDTDGIDFDGSVGLNGFSIDTSDNSDAGFWADGHTYWIHIDAITVDSQTVRFTYLLALGYTLRPTTAGRKLDVSSGGEAGIDFANIGSPTTPVNLSGTTIKTATDVETDTADLQSRIPAALSAGGNMKSSLLELIGTTLSEGAAGRIAAAFQAFFNVAGSTLTTASSNQTGDSYAIVNNGTYGNSALNTDLDALLVRIVGTLAAGTHNPQSGDSYGIVSSATFGNNALKSLIDILTAYVDTEVAAIKAKTDNLPSSPAAVGSAMVLSASGLDAVLIESGISAGAGLTNDAGTQLTSVNARQALALLLSALAGVLAGAATTTVTTKPGGLPSGNTRVSATVDADGNRSGLTLKVPT